MRGCILHLVSFSPTASGLAISNISTVGDTMTFTLGSGTLTATPTQSMTLTPLPPPLHRLTRW
ncbi:MAG TPA: hypothetical protein VEC37_09840 [Bacillota bacterium]|nr:hypothetical protein [Bacillota bacterium]